MNRIFFKIHGKFLQVSFRAGRDWDRKGVAAQKTQGKKIFIIILSPFVQNCKASIIANMTQQLLYCQDKLHLDKRNAKVTTDFLSIEKVQKKKVISWKLIYTVMEVKKPLF